MSNRLYPYQERGVEHLLSRPFGKPHALLADDPGTGKTIMAIEAAKRANAHSGIIVCPAIIKEQWARQMVSWGLCQPDEIQVLYGRKASVSKQPWVVVNYELAREQQILNQLRERNWAVLILDEAQRLKGLGTRQTHAILHRRTGLANHCHWKWCLSGTIMPNRPAELYPLLRTLASEAIAPYTAWADYVRRYCEFTSYGRLDELAERIRPFYLRRRLADVWRECPPIITSEITLHLPAVPHPELLTTPILYPPTERRLVAEQKAPLVCEYIADRLQSGIEKLVVFVYHRFVAEYLHRHLRGYSPVLIYGGEASNARQRAVDEFVTNPLCRLLIAQIISAGEGLDGLQSVCNELVLAEPEWSPGREDQAIQRVHRIGQQRPVLISKLISSGTYEERIVKANLKKRKVIARVIRASSVEKEDSMLDKFVADVVNLLTRQTVALEAIAEALKAGAPAAVVAPPAPPPPVPTPPAPPPAPPTPSPAPSPVAVSVAAPAAPAAPAAAPAAPAAAQTAAPAAPAAQAAAPVTQTAAPVTLTRAEFEAEVIRQMRPLGAEGAQKVRQALGQLGLGRVADVAEAQFSQFLALLQ